MKVSIEEIECTVREGDWGDMFIRLQLKIDGTIKRYSCQGRSVEQSIRDCYFFHTGNVANAPDIEAGLRDWDFTENLADPEDFKHIERVPPWTELPF